MTNPCFSVGQAPRPVQRRRPPRLRRMKIGIVGLGYVGLPLAVAFAEAEHEVVGLDTDPRRVDALNAGRSHIEDVPDSVLEPLAGRLRATPATRTSAPARRS